MENNINLPGSSYRTENVSYLNEFETTAASKSFMSNVFLIMGAGLAISGLVAYYFATNLQLLAYLVNPKGLSGLGMVVMFSPLLFVLVMRFGFNKLSATVLGCLFAALCIVMGISLSFILLAYTASSITICFFSGAGMFGVMAVMGYTTKKDLTTFGSILYMALFGIIIAMLINLFLHSEALDYFVSLIGVLIFTGLTAYKVQAIKNIAQDADVSDPTTMKLAILGAMSLYITFINLFLSLLRVFGRRR